MSVKKRWVWTALNKDYSEILEYVIGDRSSETFEELWGKIKNWNCYFWITYGYKVYPKFVPDGDQIISKTYMTRVEGENSRLGVATANDFVAEVNKREMFVNKY